MVPPIHLQNFDTVPHVCSTVLMVLDESPSLTKIFFPYGKCVCYFGSRTKENWGHYSISAIELASVLYCPRKLSQTAQMLYHPKKTRITKQKKNVGNV